MEYGELYEEYYEYLHNIYFNYINRTEPIHSEDEEIEEEIKIINGTQTFKSGKCVICLTNLPNILFCNCGHLCLCEECSKVKSLSVCPIYKTKNTIKRII